jgi:hypothetical protein
MHKQINNTRGSVRARKFPYPYRSMLAICSDLDETPDRRVYGEIMRYLNTTENTAMGQGVGLEVGNTIYFDMPPGQFAYWNTDDAGRELVRSLIRSGHIDCMHSYGDLATTRSHVERAVEELARHDCRLQVWVDHGTATSNFGADIMQGGGDLEGSAVYHADLTYDYGIRYVWRGRVTSVIGQDVPRRLGGVWSARHPMGSMLTVGKEFAKGVVARFGNIKYEKHVSNRLMWPSQLRSRHPVTEFLRFNPYWGGVGKGATAEGIAHVLVKPVLDTLVGREAVGVLYTHLGKIRNPDEPFADATRRAFRLLARYAADGHILVATTRRLLGYCHAMESARTTSGRQGEWDVVHVTVPDGAGEADGMTWYVRDPSKARVFLNGVEIDRVQRNPADHTGMPSVSIPRARLDYPRIKS